MTWTAEDWRWYAIANLLARRAPSGFAAQLLRGLKLDLRILVHDPGSGSGEGLGDGSDGGLGFNGIGRAPDGFPPIAIYDFAPFLDGAIVLSNGPRTIYYSRRVASTQTLPVNDPPPATANSVEPTTTDRLQYLDAIGYRNYRFGLNASRSVSVAWQDAATLLERIDREKASIIEAHDRMLQRLVADNYLTEEEIRTGGRRTISLEVGRLVLGG